MAEAQPGQVEQSSVRAPIFTFRDQVRDFARPNLFQVEIYAPPVLQDSVGLNQEQWRVVLQRLLKTHLVDHNLTHRKHQHSVHSL